MVVIGSGAQREQIDYHLSRYACYLEVKQNQDKTHKKSPAVTRGCCLWGRQASAAVWK